jgi:hypothetical protein
MDTRKRLAALALIAAAAAGCSNTRPAAAAKNTSATVSTTRPTPTATPSTPAPTPSAVITTQPTTPSFGQTQTLADSDGTRIRLTVSAYTVKQAGQNAEEAKQADRIATITANTCIDHNSSSGAISLSWDPWTLLFADGNTVQAVSAYSPTDFPATLYPNNSSVQVPAGECRHGLIPFIIPTSEQADPVKVEYSANGDLLEWVR